MKIKLLTSVAGPGIGFPDENGVIEVYDEVGNDLVKAGHAEAVKVQVRKATKKPAGEQRG